MIDHPLGVVPSPPDERDYQYRAYGRVLAADELPAEYTCGGITAVDDQGAVNSCVAHSLGLIKDWQEQAEVGHGDRYSRQWIYAHRPNMYYHKGPGMIPREALATLQTYGVVREPIWPGIVEYGQEIWPAAREILLPEAAPFAVATYVAIDYRYIPELKSAIYTTGPVLYCVPVHTNFAPDAEGLIPLPTGSLRGYHAMAIVGWKHGAWLVQNSWGTGWGQSGRCWMPWTYPALEVWGITDATTKRRRTVKVTIGSKTMLVDGKPVEMDVAPFIRDSRTFVPLRFVSEGLGAVVDYGPKPGAVEWVTAVLEEAPW